MWAELGPLWVVWAGSQWCGQGPGGTGGARWGFPGRDPGVPELNPPLGPGLARGKGLGQEVVWGSLALSGGGSPEEDRLPLSPHPQTCVLTALGPAVPSRVLAPLLGRGGHLPGEADALLPVLCPPIDTCAGR